MNHYNSILILGPTASGKTRLAVNTAAALNGEVISLDSRQVYKKLNIGTGKDLQEYTVKGKEIPFHLIDIIEPDQKYNISMFVNGFKSAWKEIIQKNKLPILCGGTGLYMDAILKRHQHIHIPVDENLRTQLEEKSPDELLQYFESLNSEVHSTADTSTRKRLIRAIEIALYLQKNKLEKSPYPEVKPLIIGIRLSVEERRKRIDKRLQERLHTGLIEEVESLLKQGIPAEQLIYFGLEYKFITEYLLGLLDKGTMITRLNTAIHQYAKRQMTWFRKMEREGLEIHWLAVEDMDGNVEKIRELIKH